MLHNHKDAKTTTIANKIDSEIEKCNVMSSLTRRSTLEQSTLIAKQRAKTEDNNYNNNNNSTTTTTTVSAINKRKNNKQQQMPQQEHDEQKLHNNQPLIANIEHLNCQTHAHARTHAYAQPYATPSNYYIHNTHTLSTFKAKTGCNVSSRNSNYFSSLDNRSQRHQHQQQQHYRGKKSKQHYDSLTPYSVANLPILQRSSGSFSSSEGNSGNETPNTVNTPRATPICKSGTSHYHMSHNKMQLQQHIKQSTKDNHSHYISPNQAKSSLPQQQQQHIETTKINSLKQNKRNKLQYRHLPNPQQGRT